MKFLPSPYKSALFENAAELSCPGSMFLVSVLSLFLHPDAVRQAGRPRNHISELTASGDYQEMLYVGERLNPVGESRPNYGHLHCRGPPAALTLDEHEVLPVHDKGIDGPLHLIVLDYRPSFRLPRM